MAMYLGISDSGLLTSNIQTGFRDAAAQKREQEEAQTEKTIVSVFSAAVGIIVSLIPGLQAAGGSLLTAVVSTVASTATQVVGDAIAGNLDEDTGTAVGTDIGVNILTLGFGRVAKTFTAFKSLAKAQSQAIDDLIRFASSYVDEGVTVTKNVNYSFAKFAKGQIKKVLLEPDVKNIFQGVGKINKHVAIDLGVDLTTFGATSVDNFLRKSILSSGGGVQGLFKTIVKLLGDYAGKLFKKGIRGNRLLKALKLFQTKVIKRIKDLVKPLAKRLEIIKKKYKSIVGGDFVKKKIEERKLEAYNNIKKESKNENNVRKMEDMNNYVVNELGVIPLSSQWILGYKINSGSNEEVATLAVYFKTNLFSGKGKRKYRSMKATMYYKDVPLSMIEDFANSPSPGSWYLEHLARNKWPSQSISVGNGLREKGQSGPAYGVAGQTAYRSVLALGVKTLTRNQQDKLKYWNRAKEIYSWVTKPYQQIEGQLFKQSKRLF